MIKEKNLLLIGCGQHAKRIYIPLLEKLENVNKIVVFDLPEKVKEIELFLKDKKQSYKVCRVYEDDFDTISMLNYCHSKYKFDGVIISTEPLQHKKYCEWALMWGIPILLDKPVSMYADVVSNIENAKKLSSDYYELMKLYDDAKKINPNMFFSVMAQRRFHTMYKLVKGYIDD